MTEIHITNAENDFRVDMIQRTIDEQRQTILNQEKIIQQLTEELAKLRNTMLLWMGSDEINL